MDLELAKLACIKSYD